MLKVEFDTASTVSVTRSVDSVRLAVPEVSIARKVEPLNKLVEVALLGNVNKGFFA